MSPEQIERAEKVAQRLEARSRRRPIVEALAEAQEWHRPRNLATGAKQFSLAMRREQYYFTDEQFRIAVASLERRKNDQSE